MHNEPLAFFITWTVYGTFLQGDDRWWRDRDKGQRRPQPLLEAWHRDRLNHEIVLLTEEHRNVVSDAIRQHCQHRDWKLWEANPRSNHVHVVVSAAGFEGVKVRDQLKANATRRLRQTFSVFQERPVWTKGGDWKCVNSKEDLEQVILYASEVQERMDRGK